MSDSADDLYAAFKAQKKEKQKKRAQNLVYSLELLRSEGIEYQTLSPHHYRVGPFDFWPSTGKFIHRESKRAGRGVRGLIRRVMDL